MRHLFRLRRPRRTASTLLLVWLFATFASWANACLVQPVAAAGHFERVGFGAGHGTAHGAAAAAGTTQAPDPARDACASFCDAEQRIVAKAQPSKGDGGAEAAVVPLAAVDGWPAFTPGRVEPRWRPRAAPPPPGPAVAIAFLRLTL